MFFFEVNNLGDEDGLRKERKSLERRVAVETR